MKNMKNMKNKKERKYCFKIVKLWNSGDMTSLFNVSDCQPSTQSKFLICDKYILFYALGKLTRRVKGTPGLFCFDKVNSAILFYNKKLSPAKINFKYIILECEMLGNPRPLCYYFAPFTQVYNRPFFKNNEENNIDKIIKNILSFHVKDPSLFLNTSSGTICVPAIRPLKVVKLLD